MRIIPLTLPQEAELLNLRQEVNKITEENPIVDIYINQEYREMWLTILDLAIKGQEYLTDVWKGNPRG